MLIIPTTHKMPAPNYNPQHNFKVCKFKIWLSPTSIPRASLSKLPMIPHLQKCRCQSAHTKIRQTDPDHHIQTKYHIYNKHSKYKPLHTCNALFLLNFRTVLMVRYCCLPFIITILLLLMIK